MSSARHRFDQNTTENDDGSAENSGKNTAKRSLAIFCHDSFSRVNGADCAPI